MAVEIKLIFVAISIFLGSIWLSGFNGLIADRFDRYNLRIASDSFFSDPDTLKYVKSNNTRVDRELRRNVISERDDFRAYVFPSNTDLNLRSYFREKNSRNKDFSRENRRIEHLASRNFNFERRQFEAHVRRDSALKSVRRVDLSDNFQNRLERLPITSFDRIRLDEQNMYRDGFRNLKKSRESRFDRYTVRNYFGAEKEIPLFRRQYRSSSRRVDYRVDVVDERRNSRSEKTSQRRMIARSMESNFKNFFQYVWNFGSLINYTLAGISNYLFTIIAGLFIFDTVGQFIPVKRGEEKGFLNLFRNFASTTGNVMVH